MAELCAIYLWLLGLAIIGWMVVDYVLGRHDLVSFRNLFLVSFVLNQCHSPADTLFYDNWWGFKVDNKDGVAIECVILTTIFVFVFALAYRWGIGAKGAAAKIKLPSFDPTPGQLLVFATVMTAIGALARGGTYVLPFVLAVLSYRTAVGLAAISCGFIGWAVGRKMRNPVFWVYGIGLLALNFAVANSGFSRRPLAAIFAALIWGFYYSYWRYQRPAGVMVKLVGLSIVPILFTAAFTSIRQSGDVDRSLGTIVSRLLTQSDVVDGLRKMSSGDACGPTELWCIENFPEQFRPKHLFTLRFFFMINIPRAIWPEKPVTLSNEIASLMRMEGADRKVHSFGAGVVGYAAAEGGLYALVIYAVCLALFVRFFDCVVQAHILNPFLVVPMASDLGQLLGLARGDVSLFAHTLATAVLFGTAITILIAWGIAPRGIPEPPLTLGPWKNLRSRVPKRQVVTVWVPAEWAAQQQGRL